MARALIVNGRIYEGFQLKVEEFKTPFFFVSFCINDSGTVTALIANVAVFFLILIILKTVIFDNLARFLKYARSRTSLLWQPLKIRQVVCL